MRIYFTLIFISLIAACVPFSTKPNSALVDIENHKQQLKTNPQNPGSLAALGERYFNLFEKTKKASHRDASIKYNQSYLDLYPQNPSVKVNLYLAYFHKVSNDFKKEDFKKLSSIFNSFNEVNAAALNPPSIASYNYKIKHNPKIDELISLLKEAIIEQPSSAFAYLKLARAYEANGYKRMAHGVISYGNQNIPDNLYLQASLGDMMMAQGKEKACQGTQEGDFNKALMLYNKILKVRPESARLRAEMAEAYFYNGRFRLALQQYKKSQELSPNDINLLDIGIIYSIIGKNEKALDYFNQSGDGYLAKKGLAVHYFSLEEWQSSLDYYQQGMALEDRHFYSRLLQSYAVSFNDKKNLGIKDLKQFVESHELSDWERKLYQFRLGNIPSSSLLTEENDACIRTEGYFYQALQARLYGNTPEYLKLLDKALQEKVYLYTEYKIAKNLARQAHL